MGRSGTFIAVDHLLQQLRDGAQELDVMALAVAMRKMRVYMVQTEVCGGYGAL